ncbi:MAG: sporulation integral membrane protein YtvI [Clostridia bacterium]|nr:sporulation integral membrane protein YtvI [Clostridia bacterium]
MVEEYKKKFLINVLYITTLGAIIYIAFKFLFLYFLPFVIAVLIAYLVQKPSKIICEKIKLKKELCAVILAVLGYVFLIAVLVSICYYLLVIARSFLNNSEYFFSQIKDLYSKIQDRILVFLNRLSPGINNTISQVFAETVNNLAVKITSILSSFAANAVKKAPSFLFSSIVALVSTCYIAKDFNLLVRFYKNLFGNNVYFKTLKIKKIVNKNVFKIAKGYLILTLITFVELMFGFYMLKISHPAFIGIFVSIVDLLPILGTGTVLIPWGLIEIMLGSTRGFGIIILYGVVIVIRNFAEPKIIGKQIGINPLFTLFSMFAGLKLMGFWGLILFPMILIVVIEYYREA